MTVEPDTTNEGGPSRAEAIVAAVKALPPLPVVALRAMQVAQDPKSSASDLALVISADPGLSATVLRAVNSAAYRRSREVTSVQEALVVLGFVQARNITVSAAIAGNYPSDALNVLFRINAFWRHSLAVAFKSAELAGKGRRLDVPSAFTAGILHNMGSLAMFFADPAAVDQAVAEAMRRDVPLATIEREMLGYDHMEVGALLARKWGLPVDVVETMSRHHGHVADNTIPGVVAAADVFCAKHGILPGYLVPDSGRAVTPDAVRLLRHVDQLMEMVGGTPAGVSGAAA
ncbi:MAG: HDOD domain-containing protein [Chloroflexi bacterium]|nr:HDOD domain-containing protein [Chloroflexota bacterium]